MNQLYSIYFHLLPDSKASLSEARPSRPYRLCQAVISGAPKNGDLRGRGHLPKALTIKSNESRDSWGFSTRKPGKNISAIKTTKVMGFVGP